MKKNWLRIVIYSILIVLVCLTIGFVHHVNEAGRIKHVEYKTAELSLDEQAVFEAAFRFKVKKMAAQIQVAPGSVCFISISDGKKPRNPPTSFLERFNDLGVPVRGIAEFSWPAVKPFVKKSDMKREESPRYRVFRFGEIHWVSKTQVEVGYSYDEPPSTMSGHGGKLSLEQEMGAWYVAKDGMSWIS